MGRRRRRSRGRAFGNPYRYAVAKAMKTYLAEDAKDQPFTIERLAEKLKAARDLFPEERSEWKASRSL